MLFLGYIEGTEIDLTVDVTNGNIIEFYWTLEELRYECGEDAEFMTIYLDGVSVESLEGNLITFDEISLN